MGIENSSSFGSFSPEQKRIEEEREMFSNEFENRAEMRNEIAKQKQTLWEKMRFWQSAPGVTMMDIAHEEALAMNQDIDQISDTINLTEENQMSPDELGSLRQATADHLVNTKYDAKGPEQIRTEEEYASLKHDILENLLDNDFVSAASLVRKGLKIKVKGDFESETQIITPEGAVELENILTEKLASLITNQDTDALEEYFEADQNSIGALGDIRNIDLLKLPGVTSEMLTTPKMKDFLHSIVISQIKFYKNYEELTVDPLSALKNWKGTFIRGGYITEEEFNALPVFKKVAINQIKYLGKSIKDRHSGINTAPVFISALQKWTELGALSEEEAYELEHKYLP